MKTKRNPVGADGFWRKPIWGLLLVVVLGGLFRFYNPAWDYEHSFHPDERNILGQTAGIQSSNGFRVQFFAYGQLPVFLYRATGELISTPQLLTQAFSGHDGFSQCLYWLFLLGLFGFVIWFFPKEKHKLVAYSLSVLFFGLALLFKFFPIFVIWFNALQDWPARLACFGWVTVAAFVISTLLAPDFGSVSGLACSFLRCQRRQFSSSVFCRSFYPTLGGTPSERRLSRF